MPARLILDQLITAHGDTYSSISGLLGRNSAYIQQFIKRGTPRALSKEDQTILAGYFRMPENFLSPSDEVRGTDSLDQVASLVLRAIEMCERLGETLAMGHFQHGLDVLGRKQ